MVHSPKSHVTTLTGIKQFVAVKNETASAIIPEGGISLMKFDIIPQRIHMAGNIIPLFLCSLSQKMLHLL